MWLALDVLAELSRVERSHLPEIACAVTHL
jgi:hypothetical protein